MLFIHEYLCINQHTHSWKPTRSCSAAAAVWLYLQKEARSPNRVTASCIVRAGCRMQIVRFRETICSSALLADQKGAGIAGLAGLGRDSGNGGVAMRFEVPGLSFEGELVGGARNCGFD